MNKPTDKPMDEPMGNAMGSAIGKAVDKPIDEPMDKAMDTATDKPNKAWTIMVYMAGDNNLSEDMITGLKGMTDIGDEANINLLALYDGCYPASPIKFYDFTQKKAEVVAYRELQPQLGQFETPIPVDGESLEEEALRGIGERDLFKLKHFVPLIIKNFQADRFALILSGHSDGVIGKTLLRDENPEIALNLITLREVLEKALKGKDGKIRKLDLIGFDGCLMGMLEVGFELKSVAKVMVASEGNIPAAGWNYKEILNDIRTRQGDMNEREFAVSIVDSYSLFNEDYAISGRSVNISACNLEELCEEGQKGADEKGSLFDIVQNLAKILCELLSLPTEVGDDVPEEVARANQLIKEKFVDWMLLSHLRSQTFMHSQAVDIVDLLYNLLLQFPKWLGEGKILEVELPESGSKVSGGATVKEIKGRIASIFDSFIAINEAIRKENKKYVLRSCSVGAEYQFSQGVSMFFPWTKIALDMIRTNYSLLRFNTPPNWLDFITKFADVTLREKREKPLFDKNLSSLIELPFDELRHKEVGGKEVGGKEVGGKEVGGKEVGGKGVSPEFYLYFSQIRNYKQDVFGRNCIDDSSFI
jgi:hypothetical protein